MTTVPQALAGHAWADALDPGDLIADAVLIARVIDAETGKPTVFITNTDGADAVTITGLIECGRQINTGGWTADREDDEQ